MNSRYRMHQIKLNMNETKSDIPKKILKKLNNRDLILTDLEIVKESLDARDKGDIKFVYTVDFQAVTRQRPKQYVNLPINPKLGLEEAPDMNYLDVESGGEELSDQPVIVGFGPCGMFAGLILAKRGYRPIIIERGRPIEQRVEDVEKFWSEGILNTESNVQFGEGGAGTFSDGKLTTGIKDPRIRKVLEEFVRAGADEDILYKQKPHIGTDVLRKVVRNIREEILRCGGEIRFDTRFVEVNTKKKCVKSVVVECAGERYEIPTQNVILAVGHSARDTFRYLCERGIKMQQKPFSIGVRIEHPQKLIDKSQYGNTEGLPPADYKLNYHCGNGRGVYTFCMCPGGEVITASSQEGGVVTNGMSNRARNSGKANSGLLVDVRCEDFGSPHPLAGIEFQEKYEKLAFENGGGTYEAPRTTWGEFRSEALSAAPVIRSLPEFAVAAIREAMPHLGRKLSGFDRDDAVMTAVETRSSSPVRFARNEEMEGTFGGFYPAGEGTGYAGGIMSAACDGIKVAEKIIGKYKPF
ncbi:NAD(P)/FAD-dependent oxidoreductase [Emergencia sp.]|uniref:NAD(P)/FAD-dependent oxidoreductase n=1 Tax=Emergencia sp. TaxID=1926557 RepID=UPI003AF169E2